MPPSNPAQKDLCYIGQVPDDVLESVLLDKLAAEDLSRLACVSQRFLAMTKSQRVWYALFADRWGKPSALMRRASQLAGGWHRLYSAKLVHEKSMPAGLSRPCGFELDAALEKLTAQKIGEKRLPVACVFLLDGSGSVNEEEFATMTNFVTTATTAIMEAAPDSKVAVVQFSNDCRVEYDMGPVDLPALASAARNMVRMNGGTNVAVAIQKAGQLLKRGAPTDALRQVVLLTDGRVDTYQAHEARCMADRLADEQRCVSLFAFGVGRGVDKPELLHIIGAPPSATTAVQQSPAGAPGSPTPSSSSSLAATASGSLHPASHATGPSPPASPGSSNTSASLGHNGHHGHSASPAGHGGLGGFGRGSASYALSWLGEEANERYLDLCVREEGPW